jgi:ribonucleoside-diphosphate reductase alpha chain
MATDALDEIRVVDADTPEDRPQIRLERRFSTPGVHPYDAVEWETRDIEIPDHATGGLAFEQRGVEVPADWSQTAAQIAASKYFRYPMDSPKRERSVKTMIDRVVETYAHYGESLGYFDGAEQRETFAQELRTLLVTQRAAFNSPVWFNTGVEERRRSASDSVLDLDEPPIGPNEPWMGQVSACFILGVDDTMGSIQEWIAAESEIFRGGSGAGTNLSRLRADGEPLSAGGEASGPVSFMRWADSGAGSIKSGGGTRRAAKMVILNGDHPDIEEFVWCKAKEEEKAYTLGDSGYDMSLNGEAWRSVQFQNANNSVRLGDDFFTAYADDDEWQLCNVKDSSTRKRVKARGLMREIAEAAWRCGDPGVQYDTTIQRWHTSPNAGRINGSNPCSEYMHLDDSACNLASINLMKFVDEDGEFMVEDFRHAVDVMILAMEIAVTPASYPIKRIGDTARNYRQLGLGYANLGALLMNRGLPYDSDEGRALAASITGLMQNRAYARSAEIASRVGAYDGYAGDKDAQDHVVRMHADAVTEIDEFASSAPVREAAAEEGRRAVELGQGGPDAPGYRNAQMTVLAPTGTIGFLMDCDTTGIEPGIALVSYKTLAGGGNMKLVNRTVPQALTRLGYADEQIASIGEHIIEHDTIEGSDLRDGHLSVFDCAFKAVNGERSIAPEGHVRMMGAVQPFISGAISKTVNMPNEATVEDIERIYLLGHEEGLKAIAIYRDGSKRTQPLRTTEEEVHDSESAAEEAPPTAVRRRLPATRQSVTHKFQIGQQEGYVTFGLFEDGTPGEVFIKMAKEGSTVSGLMESIGILWSMALQHGVPPETIISKFTRMSFEPAGFTQNPEIPMAKSIMDYLARLMASLFISDAQALADLGVRKAGAPVIEPTDGAATEEQVVLETAPLFNPGSGPEGGQSLVELQSDGTACPTCGSTRITQTGTCRTCLECGTSIGGCS